MRRAARLLVPVLVLALVLVPIRTESAPTLDFQIAGVELCPQSICGAAIFAGLLFRQAGPNLHVAGTFIVAVTHYPELPTSPGQTVPLTGGVFELRIGARTLEGIIADEGGTLTYAGGNIFHVHATLVFTSGASGTADFDGVLDHNVFPPTVAGTVSQ